MYRMFIKRAATRWGQTIQNDIIFLLSINSMILIELYLCYEKNEMHRSDVSHSQFNRKREMRKNPPLCLFQT